MISKIKVEGTKFLYNEKNLNKRKLQAEMHASLILKGALLRVDINMHKKG